MLLYDVWVMDADGMNPVNLTNSASDDGLPAWSPDGSEIVFVSYRDGNAELYTMNGPALYNIKGQIIPTGVHTG